MFKNHAKLFSFENFFSLSRLNTTITLKNHAKNFNLKKKMRILLRI